MNQEPSEQQPGYLQTRPYLGPQPETRSTRRRLGQWYQANSRVIKFRLGFGTLAALLICFCIGVLLYSVYPLITPFLSTLPQRTVTYSTEWPGFKPVPSATQLRKATPPLLPTATSTSTSPAGGGHAYYVSKKGNDANGLSWTTAWNELDQINWKVIRPGDTLLLDGGAQQMIYTTTLTVGKSGSADLPIAIRRSTEPGRNGTVSIFGGRSTLLPYCGQTNYRYRTQGVTGSGIVIGDKAWIIVDGMTWHGIRVYGHNASGVVLKSASHDDVIRDLEVFDNGVAYQRTDGAWATTLPNIALQGVNQTFEDMDIYDAGEDSFQPLNINNITVRLSWLHETRNNPTQPGLSANQCGHNDDMQIYTGAPVSGIVFDQDILGPGNENGLILGNGIVEVDNVTIKNTLILDAGSNNIYGEPQKNWTIDHVTSFAQTDNIALSGSGNRITNSIFYDGYMLLHKGIASSSNNCQWKTGGNTTLISGQTVDPLFVTSLSAYPDFANGDRSQYPAISALAAFNLALKPNSPCAGLGASISSSTQLINAINANNAQNK